MNELRLLIEPEPNAGSWNMAVDEVLLESAINHNQCSLRFYRWSQATLSLGYFQSPDAIKDEPLWQSLPIVRRLSGGGAILHHHEFTYSLAVPSNLISIPPTELYAHVHSAIIQFLQQSKIAAHMRGTSRDAHSQTFLCFSRGDRNDIVLNGKKIVGSAQRRRRGAILQHGSIVLECSQFAPVIPGIRDLVDSTQVHADSLDFICFAEMVAESVLPELTHPLPAQKRLCESQSKRAKELQETKYSRLDWRHT